MSNSWKEFTIEEIGDVIGGGTPSTKNPDYWEGDISWITPKDLSGYKYKRISKGERNITELGLTKSSAKLLPKNTVLITSRAPIGYVAIADNEVTTNQGFKSIVLKDGFDSDYVYYLIKSNVRLLESVSSGSTFKEISGNELKKLRFNFPELSQQKAIAYILGTLDNKIELNRKMNETLEQMAQALFKSWFVDFDPVLDNAIAKGTSIPEALKHKVDKRKEVISSGNYRTLPKELMELFPSSFEFNDELEKWIPEGWDVSTVSDLADVNCKSWSSKNKPTLVEYVDLGSTKSGYIQETTNYKYEEAPSRAKRILSLNDTIMATVRPGNKGYAFILEEGLTGSTGFAVLSPKQESFRTLVYLFLTREDNIDLLAHLADGGAYPAINPSVIMNLPIVNFNSEISKAFDDLVFPMFIKIQKNKNQNKALAKQRDVLLPQLISGKLRVNNLKSDAL